MTDNIRPASVAIIDQPRLCTPGLVEDVLCGPGCVHSALPEPLRACSSCHSPLRNRPKNRTALWPDGSRQVEAVSSPADPIHARMVTQVRGGQSDRNIGRNFHRCLGFFVALTVLSVVGVLSHATPCYHDIVVSGIPATCCSDANGIYRQIGYKSGMPYWGIISDQETPRFIIYFYAGTQGAWVILDDAVGQSLLEFPSNDPTPPNTLPTSDPNWEYKTHCGCSSGDQVGISVQGGQSVPVIQPLALGNLSVPPVAVGSTPTYQVSVSGGCPPYAFTISGEPAFLLLNFYTGWLSLSPTCADIGGYSGITIEVVDSEQAMASMTLSLTVQDTTPPAITLKGLQTVTAECGQDYTDEGATAEDDCCQSNITVDIDQSNVNTTAVGTYTVILSATDCHDNVAQVNRTVEVVDSNPPVITVDGSDLVKVECECGKSYTPEGAAAEDECCSEDPSVSITPPVIDASVLATHTVAFDATDCNEVDAAQETRTVIVQDTQKPVIKLAGEDTVVIECGSNYEDEGATVTDVCCCQNPSVSTDSSEVDTSTPGTYTVYYTAVDCNGLAATQQTRSVIVQDTTPPLITWAATKRYGVGSCADGPIEDQVDAWIASLRAGGDLVASDCSTPANQLVWKHRIDWEQSLVLCNGMGVYTVVVTVLDKFQEPAYGEGHFQIWEDSAPVITAQGQDLWLVEGTANPLVVLASWLANHADAQATDLCTDNADLVWSWEVILSSFEGPKSFTWINPFFGYKLDFKFIVTNSCEVSTSTTASVYVAWSLFLQPPP